MSKPTTAAGRRMYARWGHLNFLEEWNDTILAIEAEAVAAALARVRERVELWESPWLHRVEVLAIIDEEAGR